MDQPGEHLVKAIDATAREGEGEADNEQKTINHTLRAMTKLKYIPERIAGQPWYAVSITPERHHNVASGPMHVAVRAERLSGVPPRDNVDTTVNREVVLCGDSLGYWRVPLVAGVGDIDIPVNTYSPSGEGVLYVLDAAEPQRQGSTPSFTWS